MESSAERGFFVSEKLATGVYRGVQTGSGVGGSREYVLREALKDRLGLGLKSITSPEGTVAGIMLIAYVTASIRLIRILSEGPDQDPEVIQRQILGHLRVPPGETPRETLERLLEVAMENSQKINHLLCI